jgi:superoxide dismutase
MAERLGMKMSRGSPTHHDLHHQGLIERANQSLENNMNMADLD